VLVFTMYAAAGGREWTLAVNKPEEKGKGHPGRERRFVAVYGLSAGDIRGREFVGVRERGWLRALLHNTIRGCQGRNSASRRRPTPVDGAARHCRRRRRSYAEDLAL
jgi:hypothetical protein